MAEKAIRKHNEKDNATKRIMKNVLKGSIIGLIYTILCILVFAFIIKTMSLGDGMIPTINQIIKITAICLSVYMTVKRSKESIFLNGITSGMVYITLGFIVFSLVQGKVGAIPVLIADIIMSIIIGVIISVIFMRTRKETKK